MLSDRSEDQLTSSERPVGNTPTSADQRPTISVDEAGQLLGISRGLPYTLVNRGDIPSIRPGRRIVVPRQALDQLLDFRDDAAWTRQPRWPHTPLRPRCSLSHTPSGVANEGLPERISVLGAATAEGHRW
jgi:excisionase family DNA binding protein